MSVWRETLAAMEVAPTPREATNVCATLDMKWILTQTHASVSISIHGLVLS